MLDNKTELFAFFCAGHTWRACQGAQGTRLLRLRSSKREPAGRGPEVSGAEQILPWADRLRVVSAARLLATYRSRLGGLRWERRTQDRRCADELSGMWWLGAVLVLFE